MRTRESADRIFTCTQSRSVGLDEVLFGSTVRLAKIPS